MTKYLGIQFLFFLYSCANIVPPTGGPRDTEGPKVVRTSPQVGSLQYKGNNIWIEFDEYIADNQLSNKILISPTLKNPVTSKFTSKGVRISWKDTLLANTTYIFNLNEGVKDMHEGISCGTYQVVFSTGDKIDSSAIIITSSKNPFPKNTKALLYPYHDTLHHLLQFTTLTPQYVGMTDSNGIRLEHIRPGKYSTLICNDLNKNSKWDYNEEVSFIHAFDLDSTQYLLTQLQKTRYDSTHIVSFKQENFTWELEFSKGIQNVSAHINNETVDIQKNSIKKYILYTKIFQYKDSVHITVNYTDSLGILYTKKYTKLFQEVKNQISKDSLSTININKKYLKPGLDSLELTWNGYIDTSTYTGKEFIVHSTLYKIVKHSYGCMLYFNTKEKDTIFFNKNTGLQTLNNKKVVINTKSIPVKAAKEFGSITADVKTKELNYVILLKTDRNNLIGEYRNIKTLEIKLLDAGDYKIEVFIDKNGNGIYDAPELEQTDNIEEIKLLIKEITIRSNWEQNDIQLIF
jgi:hypothetical protein